MARELEGIFEEMGFAMASVRLPEAGVVYALGRTFSLVMRELAGIYQRVGLSPASFNLLVLLQRGRRRGECTQNELGRCLVVSPSDMTGLVDRLERKGLVRRAPGKDRRSKLLRITPRGEALVERVWPTHAEAVKRLARVVGAEDRATLLRALGRLREAAAS
jgi:MarR family 2-MHQ and catechol resistance regulon transcriptional repressor